MGENKKIKNATVCVINGIAFKSKLEGKVYQLLLENGFTPRYEKVRYVLIEGFKPTVPFYDRGNKSKNFKEQKDKIRDITYTPDFTFTYKGVFIVIEAKGKENDSFPLRKKLFRRLLETFETPHLFFEVRNAKEVLQAIKIIKSYEPKTTLGSNKGIDTQST